MGQPVVERFVLPGLAHQLRERTVARIAVGRAGVRPITAELLRLRTDHAAACDAVLQPLDSGLPRRLGCLLELRTRSRDRKEYLLNPELGRLLRDEDASSLAALVPSCDVLVAVGDGLSTAAVHAQAPVLVPALIEALGREGIASVAGPVFVHGARVGVMNSLGKVANARVVALLVGERPGLSTAESLSIYMGFEPRPGKTDADRNLLSNVHATGIPPEDAARTCASWIASMLRGKVSGVRFKP